MNNNWSIQLVETPGKELRQKCAWNEGCSEPRGQHGAPDQRSGNLSAQDKSLCLCGSVGGVGRSLWQPARSKVEREQASLQ